MLTDYSKKKNKFSASYPNTDAINVSDNSAKLVKGKFEDLSMQLSLGIEKDDVSKFVNLFEWTTKEESELAVLANKGLPNNLEYKKLKHLFELFNTAYLVAMNPNRDMSELLPCGW